MIKTSHQLHSINPETERLGGEKELHKARLEIFNSWAPTYSISHGTDKTWSLKTPCFSSLGYTWVFCFVLQDFFFFFTIKPIISPCVSKITFVIFWKVTLAFLDNSPYDNFCIIESFIKNKQTRLSGGTHSTTDELTLLLLLLSHFSRVRLCATP